MNNELLNSTLTINEIESVDELILRMENLVSLLDQDDQTRGFIPFTRTYLSVTKAVSDGRRDFNNFEQVEQLDLVFADQYFNKLRLYINGSLHNPWRTFIDYSRTTKYIPFLAMLLGINTHINGDLAISLSKTSPQDKEDFDRVNQILKDVTPRVMTDLFTKDGDLLGLAAEVFMPFVERELDKIIVKWRENAWDVNTQLATKNWFTRRPAEKSIYIRTESLSRELIDIFDVDSLKDGANFLKRIHELELPSID